MKEHEILSTAISSGVHAIALGNEDRAALISMLSEKLGVRVDRNQIWGLSNAPSGVFCTDGWKLIATFVGDNPCLLFTQGMNFAIRLNNGKSLLMLIEQCPLFEFYVCDQEASYILCHNEHDYLIGWGKAEPWVQTTGSDSHPD